MLESPQGNHRGAEKMRANHSGSQPMLGSPAHLPDEQRRAAREHVAAQRARKSSLQGRY